MNPKKHQRPKILGETIAYKSPWFDVVAKEVVYPWRKKTETYFSVRGKEYCTAVAVTWDGYIVLVRQFRPVSERFTYELPSGCIEGKETPEQATRRELLEETGYRVPKKMELLGKLNPDSGRLENWLWGYFASDVRLDPKRGKQEPGIETVLCSPRELRNLMVSGRFDHAPHLGLISLAVMKGKLSL